jgi:hypothetical protein
MKPADDWWTLAELNRRHAFESSEEYVRRMRRDYEAMFPRKREPNGIILFWRLQR